MIDRHLYKCEKERKEKFYNSDAYMTKMAERSKEGIEQEVMNKAIKAFETSVREFTNHLK